jgi:hypothetical protein
LILAQRHKEVGLNSFTSRFTQKNAIRKIFLWLVLSVFFISAPVVLVVTPLMQREGLNPLPPNLSVIALCVLMFAVFLLFIEPNLRNQLISFCIDDDFLTVTKRGKAIKRFENPTFRLEKKIEIINRYTSKHALTVTITGKKGLMTVSEICEDDKSTIPGNLVQTSDLICTEKGTVQSLADFLAKNLVEKT